MCMKTWNLPGMYEQLKKASVLTVMMLVREFQKGGKISPAAGHTRTFLALRFPQQKGRNTEEVCLDCW